MDRWTPIFDKITSKLREGKPPTFMFTMGFWLARHLTPEEITALTEYSTEVGEDAANVRMVKAMVGSGKYKSTDGVHVEKI
jgi:hypothetical protein